MIDFKPLNIKHYVIMIINFKFTRLRKSKIRVGIRMKALIFLFLPVYFFSQQTITCHIPETEVLNFSKSILGSSEIQTKKTKLGYVAQTEKLKAVFVLQNSSYNLANIQGSRESIFTIWKTYFNPAYSETATNYENTIQKKNGSDVRLQKYQDQYYIEVYSCAD